MHPLKQINQNYRLQPMNFLTRFYRISSPVPRRQLDPAQEQKLYKRLRLQAFIAATLGYSLYYVCRTSLNVMKKAYPRQRHARRHADRGDQLGPPVRIRRREVRERIHRRLLQHQAFHGHRTDRIGRGEHAHGSARRRALGDSDSRHLHFIRRDVGG